MRVFECQPADEQRWSDFAAGCTGATYAHWFAWKNIIEAAYGLRAPFLAAEDGGRLIGIFPTAIMPRLAGGRARAVSLAFCNYGDVLAAGADMDAVRTACLAHLARSDVETVEIRALGATSDASPIATLRLDLPASEEALWRQVGDKVRNQVRKAERNGLTVHWMPDGLDDFYDVYADNLGHLGTPVHSRRFFREMAAALGPRLRILIVRDGSTPVGAMLSFVHGAEMAIAFAATRWEARSANASMLLYWEALRQACTAGMTRADFGRSTIDSGPYRFKLQWGARSCPLMYRTFRDGVVSARSSATIYRSLPARMAAGTWKRLPSGLQLRLGPHLRRWMP